MTSRSRCSVVYEDSKDVISSSSEVITKNKYKIRKIRAADSSSAAHDPIMTELCGSISSIDRIMHTCPGVFERSGDEIFVDIISHSRDIDFQWTALPCFLTVGICPYFQRDISDVTAEVSLVSDPSRKARFSYREIDEWKISFLFQLGSIPYPADALNLAHIGRRGKGDITSEIHREGFAVGVAKALREIEK